MATTKLIHYRSRIKIYKFCGGIRKTYFTRYRPWLDEISGRQCLIIYWVNVILKFKIRIKLFVRGIQGNTHVDWKHNLTEYLNTCNVLFTQFLAFATCHRIALKVDLTFVLVFLISEGLTACINATQLQKSSFLCRITYVWIADPPLAFYWSNTLLPTISRTAKRLKRDVLRGIRWQRS